MVFFELLNKGEKLSGLDDGEWDAENGTSSIYMLQ
jgi:hypothetical protein